MKKYTLLLCIFSIVQFQLDASEKEREEFINNQNAITPTVINNHYQEFIDNTKTQYSKLNWGKFFGETFIMKFAHGLYGYTDFAQRLIWIGTLFLDKNYQERIDTVLKNPSEENLSYLNDTKNYVLKNLTHPYKTTEALNETIYLIHQCHVKKLKSIDNNMSENERELLLENSQKIHGHYPMYNYLLKYKKNHNGELPPLIVLNSVLVHLLADYKIIPKGS